MSESLYRLEYGYHPEWLDEILAIFNKTTMKRPAEQAAQVNLGFSNSQVVVSCWQGDQIVGFARMLTDFAQYAAIFDLVVDPAHQGQHLGTRLLQALQAKVPDCRILLTSTMGNEGFYYKQGYRFHKTAMARYPQAGAHSPYLDHARQPDLRPKA